MNEQTRGDIRSLLKTFGIQADEAITAYLADVPGNHPLQLRVTLEDVTEHDDDAPAEPLHMEIEGQVRR